MVFGSSVYAIFKKYEVHEVGGGKLKLKINTSHKGDIARVLTLKLIILSMASIKGKRPLKRYSESEYMVPTLPFTQFFGCLQIFKMIIWHCVSIVVF